MNVVHDDLTAPVGVATRHNPCQRNLRLALAGAPALTLYTRVGDAFGSLALALCVPLAFMRRRANPAS